MIIIPSEHNKIIQPGFSPDIIRVSSNQTGQPDHKFIYDVYISTDFGLNYTKISRLKSIGTVYNQVEISEITRDYLSDVYGTSLERPGMDRRQIERIDKAFLSKYNPLLKVKVLVGEEFRNINNDLTIYDGNDTPGEPSVVASIHTISAGTLDLHAKNMVVKREYNADDNGRILNNIISYVSTSGRDGINNISLNHLTLKPLTNRPLNIDLYRTRSLDKEQLQGYSGTDIELSVLPEFDTKLFEPITLSFYEGSSVGIEYTQPLPNKTDYDMIQIEKGGYTSTGIYDMFVNHISAYGLSFYDPSGRFINEVIIEVSDGNHLKNINDRVLDINESLFGIRTIDINPQTALLARWLDTEGLNSNLFTFDRSLVIAFNNRSIGDKIDAGVMMLIDQDASTIFNVNVETPDPITYYDGKSLCQYTPPDELVINATFTEGNNWGVFMGSGEYFNSTDRAPVLIAPTPTPTPTPTPLPVYTWSIVSTDSSGDPCAAGDEYFLYSSSPNFLSSTLYTDAGLNNLWVENRIRKIYVVENNTIYDYDGESFIGSIGTCVGAPTPTPIPTATPTPTPLPVYTFSIVSTDMSSDPCVGGDEFFLYSNNSNFTSGTLYTDAGLNNLWTENRVRKIYVVESDTIYEYDGENFIGTLGICGSTGYTITNSIDSGVIYEMKEIDGKIYVGGDFYYTPIDDWSAVGNIPSGATSQLIRFNSDFSLDVNMPRAFRHGYVITIEDYNGYVWLGGYDDTANMYIQVSANSSATISDMELFTINKTTDYYDYTNPIWYKQTATGDYINDMMVDGSYLYVVGRGDLQNHYSSQTAPNAYIARITSGNTLDMTYNPGISLTSPNGVADPNISHLYKAASNKIYAGGFFIDDNGGNALLRLNDDGSYDNTYTPPTFNTTGTIRVIKQINNDKIYLGGTFTSVNGDTTKGYICRLNADGSLDNSFSLNLGGSVWDIEEGLNGETFISGQFSSLNGDTTKAWLFKLNSAGNLDTSFNSGLTSTAYSLLKTSGNKLLVGTNFNGQRVVIFNL